MQKEMLVGDRERPNMKAMPRRRLRRGIYISTALAIVGLTFCLTAQAQTQVNLVTNLVTNGDFSVGAPGTSARFGPQSDVPEGAGYVTGWTGGSGLQFVVTTAGPGPGAGCDNGQAQCLSNTATSNQFRTHQFGIPFTAVSGVSPTFFSKQGLWGPTSNPTSANGFTAPPPAACLNGGGTSTTCNYLGIDDDAFAPEGSVSQQISVVKGDKYDVSFWFAAAQLRDPAANNPVTGTPGRAGQVSDGIRVTFGTDSSGNLFPLGGNLNCPAGNGAGQPGFGGFPGTSMNANCTIPSRGFKGWTEVSETFTAQTTGLETLTFTGVGSPAGFPPVSLITGVDVAAVSTPPVPEPSTWALVGAGLVLLGIATKRRRGLGTAAGLVNM